MLLYCIENLLFVQMGLRQLFYEALQEMENIYK